MNADYRREQGSGPETLTSCGLSEGWGRRGIRTPLAQLCQRLIDYGEIAAVYSWHDLRHPLRSTPAFVGDGLRNVLNADIARM